MSISNIQQPEGWLTPEEQLKRLTDRTIEMCYYVQEYASNVNPGLVHSLFDRHLVSLIQSYLIQVEYPPELSSWYQTVKILHHNYPYNTVPPIPDNILEILDSNCPIKKMDGELKEDGTPFKVKDTHFLFLKPTLNVRALQHYFCHVMRQNDGTPYPPNQNPYQLIGFNRDMIIAMFGYESFDLPEWKLIYKGVFNKSLNKSYENQEKLMKKLSRKAKAHYEMPSLHDIVSAAYFYDFETRGKRLYTKLVKERNLIFPEYDHTVCTNVQETIFGRHVTCGNNSDFVLTVDNHTFNDSKYFIGITPVRNLAKSLTPDPDNRCHIS